MDSLSTGKEKNFPGEITLQGHLVGILLLLLQLDCTGERLPALLIPCDNPGALTALKTDFSKS